MYPNEYFSKVFCHMYSYKNLDQCLIHSNWYSLDYKIIVVVVVVFFGYVRNLKFGFPSSHPDLALPSLILNCQNIVFHIVMEITPQLEDPSMELLIFKVSSGIVAPPWGIWYYPRKAEAKQNVHLATGKFCFCIQDREGGQLSPSLCCRTGFYGMAELCVLQKPSFHLGQVCTL